MKCSGMSRSHELHAIDEKSGIVQILETFFSFEIS